MAQQPFIAKHGLQVGNNQIVDNSGNLRVPGNIVLTGTGTIQTAPGQPDYATKPYVDGLVTAYTIALGG